MLVLLWTIVCWIITVAMGWCAPGSQLVQQAKLACVVVLLQCESAAMSIIALFALNQGMSHYILVSYRMAVASAIIVPFAIVLDRFSLSPSHARARTMHFPWNPFNLLKFSTGNQGQRWPSRSWLRQCYLVYSSKKLIIS